VKKLVKSSAVSEEVSGGGGGQSWMFRKAFLC